jgi:hypothetical protein
MGMGNEAPWYYRDMQPLGWIIYRQTFIDGPAEGDIPLGLMREESYARLACETFNKAREESIAAILLAARADVVDI